MLPFAPAETACAETVMEPSVGGFAPGIVADVLGSTDIPLVLGIGMFALTVNGVVEPLKNVSVPFAVVAGIWALPVACTVFV